MASMRAFMSKTCCGLEFACVGFGDPNNMSKGVLGKRPNKARKGGTAMALCEAVLMAKRTAGKQASQSWPVSFMVALSI